MFDIKLEAKQTEPPARYSQGKLVQEMEKRGPVSYTHLDVYKRQHLSDL